MKSLRNKLEVVYQKQESMEKYFPFEETFERLDTFLTSEIVQGREFLNPYRFANVTGQKLSRVLVQLFYIASVPGNEIIQLKYRYTCPNGTDTFLYEDDLIHFKCDEDCSCGTKMNLRELILDDLIDIPVFFEIHHHLQEELLQR